MKTVEYRELFTHDYNNVTVGITLPVTGDEPDCVNNTFNRAKEWVQMKLKEEHAEYKSLADKICDLQNQIFRLDKLVRLKMAELRHQDKMYVDNIDDLPF